MANFKILPLIIILILSLSFCYSHNLIFNLQLGETGDKLHQNQNKENGFNLLNQIAPLSHYDNINSINQNINLQNFEQNLPGEISINSLTEPVVLRIIISDSSTGEPINYAVPNLEIDISVLVTGPFDNNNLKVELKRDIVLGVDTVSHTQDFNGITMSNTTQAWFNVTG
jgi:hypothetical protein